MGGVASNPSIYFEEMSPKEIFAQVSRDVSPRMFAETLFKIARN
jgi:hypothetical protein